MKITKSDISKIRRLVDLAVEEDFAGGDPTTQIAVPGNPKAAGYIVPRERIIVCGTDVVNEVLKRYSRGLKLGVLVRDGCVAGRGQAIARISGPLKPMLSAERVVLNFLQRLCGISTTTAQYVAAVEGTGAGIFDTRKTTPGWRILEKYAVRCGGGFNHRMDLSDAVMFKDNHFVSMGAGTGRVSPGTGAACRVKEVPGRLKAMAAQARRQKGVRFVVVEVDRIDEFFRMVLQTEGVDIILLDNIGPAGLRKAVEMRNRIGGKRPLLEASGGITLKNVAAIAQSGVERISTGAITHSSRAVDIGFDIEGNY